MRGVLLLVGSDDDDDETFEIVEAKINATTARAPIRKDATMLGR
jgi:hypothetical protein